MHHHGTFPRRRPWLGLALAALLCGTGPALAQDAVGINAHVPTDDELDALADLGVGWVRVDANWLSMEPRQGDFRWGEMDRVVNGARARGLQVYMTLAYAPAWASEGDDDGVPSNDVPRDGLYAAFVRAAVARYQDRVTHFGIWNEPNLPQFWAGTQATYLSRILRPGAQAVRDTCPECQVVGPDLAGVSGWQSYLEDVLRAASDSLDIVAHHTYAGVRGTRGGGQWICDDFQHAIDIGDDAICFYKPGLRQVLDLVGWQGQVWLSETGYRGQPWDRDSEQEKQRLTVEGTLALQRTYPWWTHTFFYELSDCGVRQPDCPIDGYGLLRRTAGPDNTWQDNFLQKPAFTWLRQTLAGPEWADMAPPDAPPPPPPPPPAALDAPRRDAGVPDGRIDDWDAQGCVRLDRWEADGPARPAAADLSARACAAWSDAALWLAVEVADDTHSNGEGDDTLWRGDSVQLAVDVDADGGDGGYDDDDAEWTVALVNGVSRIRAEHGDRPATGVVRREGERTVYELRVPLAGLQAGRSLRASFLVNEADGAGREGWLEWTAGIGRRKAPGEFGEIRLAPRAAVPPDGGPPDEPEDARPPPPMPTDDAAVTPPALDAGPPAGDAQAPVGEDGGPGDPSGPDANLSGNPAAPSGPAAAADEGCRAAPGGPAPWGLVLCLLALVRRRRR